jgi:hypothetical protein
MTVAELGGQVPSIPWLQFFTAILPPEVIEPPSTNCLINRLPCQTSALDLVLLEFPGKSQQRRSGGCGGPELHHENGEIDYADGQTVSQPGSIGTCEIHWYLHCNR